ncbi:MAG: alpha/beta hydrolase, partial [Candidatus Lokiarchaeota archaeon]|nr:alpha/beta hydrolase [Candidatus Lokiarchaeota archaeon]
MIPRRTMLQVATLLFTAMSVASICALYGIDPELTARQDTTFIDPAGETLAGSYYPGRVPRGAVILHGFSGEQVIMRNVASEMASMGLHVLTFDFSGHGQSPGTITMDNARVDRLAKQVLAAKEHLKALAGLTDAGIVLVGHSMGARVAIEAETIDANPVACIVAMGASINLLANTQSEFFTGTSDADIEWIQALNATNPPVDLLVITGEWDDILTPASATTLIAKLRDGSTPGSPQRLLEVIPATVHNFEVYSPGAMAFAKPFIAARLGLATGTDTAASRTISRSAWWIVFAIAAFGAILAGTAIARGKENRPPPDTACDAGVQLQSFKRYAAAKFLLWIPAAVVGLVISMAFFALPLGLPIFNLIYVAFIGGHGVLLVLLYNHGRMPGTRGKLVTSIKHEFTTMNAQDWAVSAAIMGGITVACALFYNTGLAGIYPLNDRLAWLAIFTAFTSLGFFTTPCEGEILARAPSQPRGARLLLPIAGLFPFMLVAAFFGALGSISGMIGALQGLAALAFTITCWPLVHTTSKNKLVTAM